MKKYSLALLLVLSSSLATLSTGCIIVSDGGDSDLTIDNASDFVLVDIALRGSGDFDYGPNLLGADALFPDETLTVQLDCDVFDVLVTDELNTTCELIGLDLCFDSAVWVITNGTLNSCAFAGEFAQPKLNTQSEKPFSDRVIDARKGALTL